MSFSTDVKEELSKINNLANKNEVKNEFIGYLLTVNISIINSKLRFSTESEYNINRFSKLLNNLNIQKYNIDLQGKSYVITSDLKQIDNIIDIKNILENKIFEKEIKKLTDSEEKSIVRGCFLGSGSINNPDNKYHMEIILKEEEYAQYIISILKKYSIDFKVLNKSNCYSIYTKDGEEISKFLAYIGAGTSVLKFEDIRVYREMRNNVNRIVNCETANLSKTINASVKQIEAIKLIKEKGKFGDLTENLQEIANIRIENPEATLTELGEMLEKTIGKSGVNHRLKAIIKFAEQIE